MGVTFARRLTGLEGVTPQKSGLMRTLCQAAVDNTADHAGRGRSKGGADPQTRPDKEKVAERAKAVGATALIILTFAFFAWLSSPDSSDCKVNTYNYVYEGLETDR
eukprot:scaffold376202_cov16-Prasinocladus_malaysianus.AAC.1